MHVVLHCPELNVVVELGICEWCLELGWNKTNRNKTVFASKLMKLAQF